MSGICGIVNLDGAPVDRRELAGMTEALAFRGPDGQSIWASGAAGFGYSLLKTTYESARDHQPLTVDGRLWIVADARVDARAELIAALKSYGEEVATGDPDGELILRAYRVWSMRCVEHLLGDFAFAVWDAPRRRLFCARDHMGIKPLFYARVGTSIVFSNTLDCIRRHSAVSDQLNYLAIGDFLLFDLNQDKATTAFRDIQRLQPAHSATWSEAGMQVSRYWTLPIDEPIYFARRDEYVEQFEEFLRRAVADRLRTDRIGIFMSGGLDSPTLAATARDMLGGGRSAQCGVRAFTTTYEGYDEERHYAGMAAASLGIPIDFRGWEPRSVDPQWYNSTIHTPEPVPYPMCLAADRVYHRRVAAHSPVVLYGEGPDNALRYEWRPYVSHLVENYRVGRLFKDLYNHTVAHHRIPLPASILGRLRPRQPAGDRPLYPDWLNPDFEKGFGLRDRWEEIQSEPRFVHPVRPEGYRSFDLPLWQGVFDGFDAVYSGALWEVRYPFLDLRVLRYLLAVPALPWCREKYLLRRAMRGVLPEALARRRKAPVDRTPWSDLVLEGGLPALTADPKLEAYVDTKRAHQGAVAEEGRFWVDLRPLSLNLWLRNLHNLTRTEEDLANGVIRQAASI